VIVDGRAVMSCKVPVGALEGSKVVTIEGLAAGATHPVQQAWLAEQVTMCGACEPGFIMAIAAMLDSGGGTDADIDALPNRCRCGAYPRIRQAIERAASALGGAGAAGGVAENRAAPAEHGDTTALSPGSSDEAHVLPQ
jgi:isoquinoline 1-oxidoreductase alpha subunit